MLVRSIHQVLRGGVAVLSVLLLVPVPVLALSFGNWTVISGSWTDNGSTAGGSKVTNSTLAIQPSSGSTPAGTTASFVFQVPVTFTVTGSSPGDSLAVTASSLSGLQLTGGLLQIQVAVLIPVGTTTVPVPLTNPNPNVFSGPYPQTLTLSASNQFVSVVSGTNTYNLQVSFTFNPGQNTATSWTKNSSPVSISFGP